MNNIASYALAAALSITPASSENRPVDKNACNSTQEEILERVKKLVVPEIDGELKYKCNEATMYFANQKMAPVLFRIHGDGVISGCTPDASGITCRVPHDAIRDKEKSWEYWKLYWNAKTGRKET